VDTLAGLVNVSVAQIARWESGPSDPAASFVVRLAQALAVSTDYLLGLADQPIAVTLDAKERKLVEAYRSGTLLDLLRKHLQSTRAGSPPTGQHTHRGLIFPYRRRTTPEAAMMVRVETFRYECLECGSALNAPSAVGHPRCPHCGTDMVAKTGNQPLNIRSGG
jgi:transcriptional regulator with XRE-family HTH domain/DNA-directed RNA polymerase subunit RPC12/RpoP